jgi:hypothetical protein
MDKQIVYEDATVTVHYSLFGGDVSVTVACRTFNQRMTLDSFAALIYPAIEAAADDAAKIVRQPTADAGRELDLPRLAYEAVMRARNLPGAPRALTMPPWTTVMGATREMFTIAAYAVRDALLPRKE